MGFGVSQRDCFPPKKRPKHEDLESLKSSLKDVMARLNQVERELNETKMKQSDLSTPSDKNSSTHASDNIPEGVSCCKLCLSSPKYHVVGSGKVFNIPGDKIHTRPLPIGHVKVSPEVAFEPDAILPLPIDDEGVTTMRDAIGTFVAWPKNLITIDEVISEKLKDNVGTKSGNTKKSVVSPAKNRGKEGIQNHSLEIGNVRHTPYCNYLGIHVDLFMRSQNTTHGVIMEKEIFGKYFEESIGVDEINNVLQHRWIGVSEICVYIRYLYENFMVQNQSSRRFFFLSPHETGFVLKKQEQQKSLVDLLVQNGAKDKLVLAPYNISVHWVLLAINVKADTIYYLDSMHGDPVNHRDMVDIFNIISRGTSAFDIQKNR